MVWGMSIPSTFGEFWPDGHFEFDTKNMASGWRNRLRLHYLAQKPGDQMRLFDYGDKGVGYGAGNYQGYAIKKFVTERGARNIMFPEMPPCSSIEPDEPPQTFDTEKTYKALGSLIALNSGLLAVDDELKAIIERLEPSAHQFFPIKINMPRGAVFPKPYYVLVIGQYLDSFSPEYSKEGSFTSGSGFHGYTDTKKSIGGLALSKSAFGKTHLWRERRFLAKLTCFSDELMAEIDKAGLRLPKHYKMKEV